MWLIPHFIVSKIHDFYFNIFEIGTQLTINAKKILGHLKKGKSIN